MDWEKVVDYLREEALSLKDRSVAFGSDQKTKDEMWGRARLADLLSHALHAGLKQ
jgi:hypothetical protein